MQKYINKINTLVESFPYIKDFHGKTIVIKFGGNAMIDENLKKKFALDMLLLKYVGINPVVVHGGGPQIGKLLSQIGKETKFESGLRITDSETMSIAEMVLVGQVNKEIVNNINQEENGRAVGLSGKDGNLITAHKIYHYQGNDKIDIGQVGSVKSINPHIIETLEKANFIPIIAPIGVDENGTTYNINADTAAGKIAESLKAEKLILLTDVEGIKINNELANSLTDSDVAQLIDDKVISGGMIPKANCCVNALNNGVNKTHIIDGRIEHAVLLEVFTSAGIGTQISKEEENLLKSE